MPPISIEPYPLHYHCPILNCPRTPRSCSASMHLDSTRQLRDPSLGIVYTVDRSTQHGLLPALADTSSHPLRSSACKCTIHLLGPDPGQKECVFRSPTMLIFLLKRSVIGPEEDGRDRITHTAIGTSSLHAHFDGGLLSSCYAVVVCSKAGQDMSSEWEW